MALKRLWRNAKVQFIKPIGASGSWAEPYFLAPTLSLKGVTYTPGILWVVQAPTKCHKGILGSIPNEKITDLL